MKNHLGWVVHHALGAGVALLLAAAAHAQPPLKLVQSIQVIPPSDATPDFRVFMEPDGKLRALVRSANGDWSMHVISDWERIPARVKVVPLSHEQVVSGMTSRTGSGTAPGARYLIISSSDGPPQPFGKGKGGVGLAHPEQRIMVFDLKTDSAVAAKRVGEPQGMADFDNYGFGGEDILITLTEPSEPPSSNPASPNSGNDFTAWKLPELTRMVSCHQNYILKNPENPRSAEPEPHDCDALLKAIRAASVEEMWDRINGLTGYPVLTNSRIGRWERTNDMTSIEDSPDRKIELREGYFPGASMASHLNNSIVLQDTATGKTLAQIVPEHTDLNWMQLASGADGKNYLLMLEPHGRINVYRCPEQ